MFGTWRIDPRLARQLENADVDTLVYAILIVGDDTVPWTAADDGGLGARLVAELSARHAERPAMLRCMPRANAVVLAARPALLRALVADPRVALASATTIDLFSFP